MGQAAEKLKFTAEEFLAWDDAQTVKHEYADGDVYAMAGVEDRHATVMLNCAMALRQHLRGTPCRVFATDVKLRVEASNAYFYPDVFVTCSEADQASPRIKRDASLVIEVLSPSTAGDDRGEKFAHYRASETLREYVLIDLDTRRSDVYRKGPDGLWVLHPFEAGAAVQWASVGLTLAAELLFEDVGEALPDAEAELRTSAASP